MDTIRDHYNLLWKLIIRPPRDKYELTDLGPARFLVNRSGPVGCRTDLELKNDRGLRLQCSYFRPEEGPKALPVVVYLHGNCSSRVECLDVLETVLSRGMGLFAFDCAGSGKSGGDFISLGWFERDDVRCVVQHLRDSGIASAVGLWGRSMGGATSVLYAGMDPELAGIVADSAFGSLPQVAEELVRSGPIAVPGFLLNLALEAVKSEVEARAGFNIYELVPLDGAAFTHVPALLATATDDTFVLPHHTKDIFKAWACEDKLMVHFEGGHNGEREDWFKEKAADFLLQRCRDAASRPAPPPGAPPMTGVLPSSGQRLKEKERDAREAMEKSRPERLRHVVEGVIMLGFSEECGWEAARRHSSVEAAVEWVLQLSAEASNTLKAPQSMAQVPQSRPLNLKDLRAADAAGALGATPLSPMREDAPLNFAPPRRPGEAEEMSGANVGLGFVAGSEDHWKRPDRGAGKKVGMAVAPEPILGMPPTGVVGDVVPGLDPLVAAGERQAVQAERQGRQGRPGGVHDLDTPRQAPGPEVGAALNRAVSEAQAVAQVAPSTRALADLKRELLNFGVSEQAAEDAAKRHSSMEAAVEWLIARGQL